MQRTVNAVLCGIGAQPQTPLLKKEVQKHKKIEKKSKNFKKTLDFTDLM